MECSPADQAFRPTEGWRLLQGEFPLLDLRHDARWPLVYTRCIRILWAVRPLGIGTVFSAAAVVISLLFTNLMPEMHAIPFFIAVLLASWYGGLRAGLLATVLSTALLDYFYIPPLRTFGVQILPVCAFASTALVMGKLVRDRRLAEVQVQRLNRELEQRVHQRTGELKETNLRLSAEVREHAKAVEELRCRSDELFRMNERLQFEVEDRRAAERELQRSNAELDRFASIVGHDLQAPLRAIIGFASLALKHADQDPSETREFIEEIAAGAHRMKALVEGLLCYARTGSREASRTKGPMNISLDWALANLRAVIDESHAEIKVGALPEVCIDHAVFVHVWQNLIGNSIKYRSAAPLCIEIRAECVENEWVFAVRDNGIGIAREHHGRIFDLFTRLHTEAEYTGQGIGLALCRKIVERHKGRIWVESRPGEGSCFYFALEAKVGQEPRDLRVTAPSYSSSEAV